MDKYGLTLKVNGENTVAFRAFTLFSDVEMSWLQSCQIGGHFHMQMTFRQLVANSFGLYLIRKWTWVKRQKSSSRFIIALIMDFCSSFNSNSISKSFKSLEMAPTARVSVQLRLIPLLSWNVLRHGPFHILGGGGGLGFFPIKTTYLNCALLAIVRNFSAVHVI